jgi:hypothetical protein
MVLGNAREVLLEDSLEAANNENSEKQNGKRE